MTRLSTILLVLGWVGEAFAGVATGERYVPADQLSRCPPVRPRRTPPKDSRDVRPDDIRIIMAIGDSITAGMLARGEHKAPGIPWLSSPSPDAQAILSSPPTPDPSSPEVDAEGWRLLGSGWQEFRGLSYSIGADPGAVTIPNILSHWSPFLRGGSTGVHGAIGCLGPWCGHPVEDGLNAAISGSTASALVGQVDDYLLPMIKEMRVEDGDWKLLNIGIGGNDICAFCLAPNMSLPLMGTPKQFANDIKRAVEHLRERVPNLMVNIVGSLRVSAIYELTKQDPYCSNPIRTPITPRPPLECSCALLPGPAGDYTRQKMDDLGQAYDEAVIQVIRDWESENDPSFGALWQPGTIVDLANWPVESLSPVDCFHPSEKTHMRVAAGVWNRFMKSLEERARPIVWEDSIKVRCLKEHDRFPVGRAFE